MLTPPDYAQLGACKPFDQVRCTRGPTVWMWLSRRVEISMGTGCSVYSSGGVQPFW
jgi:hypothetical protein